MQEHLKHTQAVRESPHTMWKTRMKQPLFYTIVLLHGTLPIVKLSATHFIEMKVFPINFNLRSDSVTSNVEADRLRILSDTTDQCIEETAG